MPSAAAAELLVTAQSEVKRASDLLIAPTPEALNGCQNALQSAISQLNEYRAQHSENQPDSGAALLIKGLRTEVVRAGRLLQNLARFHQGWDRVLGSISGGYLAGGSPAPVARTGRICCRG